MVAQKPGFLQKYLVVTRRFGKKPGFFVGVRKNSRIGESDLTDISGGGRSDTMFFISARMNLGACNLTDRG